MSDTVIENPTYMEHVRHFFEDVDLEHMFNRGVDLTTYPALKAEASRVYQITRPPDAFMPPEPDRKWSEERHKSFRNWITTGHPLGKPEPQAPKAGTGPRIRKDARDLSADEIATLSRAFQGMMDLPPDDEFSYFALAGKHWYPGVGGTTRCLHHEDRYHSWHRVYMREFEDALRSIEGCEDVTMPYWDITAAPPDFLFAPPFDSYTAQADIHRNPLDPNRDYPAGYQTSHYDAAEIMENVALYAIPENIQLAMGMFDWQQFAFQIERKGHDSGHGASGETLSVSDAASFDPLFWFFHSNWDRLWWEWQQIMQATTVWSFRSTIISGNTEFLTSGFNDLPPFSEKAGDVIDLAATGVSYALPTPQPMALRDAQPEVDFGTYGSLAATRNIRVAAGPKVSVMLKGINRLVIPGTFRTVLKADGEPIARQAFFQSTEPTACSACREKAVIDVDFLVDAEAVIGRQLTADIELLAPGAERIGRRFPLSSCGNPTLNVRLPLQEVP